MGDSENSELLDPTRDDNLNERATAVHNEKKDAVKSENDTYREGVLAADRARFAGIEAELFPQEKSSGSAAKSTSRSKSKNRGKDFNGFGL